MGIEARSGGDAGHPGAGEECRSREDLTRALAGDPAALGDLVRFLGPVLQVRVARALLRNPASTERNVRQEVEDMVQEVLLVLFRDDARVLRTWNPDKGLSFRNFVGMVAERQVASLLRSGKRSPWKEEPRPEREFEGPTREASNEDRAAGRERLRHLLRLLNQELSPLGRRLFQMLFVDELSVGEIRAETGMSADAVYAWRSRLRRTAAKLLRDIETEIGPSRRKPLSGGGKP